jgi:hypothetical protein
MLHWRVGCLLVASLAVLAATSTVDAQSPDVLKAEALRSERNFEQAAELLRTHLQSFPEDGDAARLLGQTLYWLHDERGAVLVYEDALVRHPADTQLRLEYAQMLAETGNRRRARQLLSPLREISVVRADALTLLGTLDYWEGDLTSAKKLFTEAVAARPEHPSALRQLGEINAATASWVRISPTVWHDDQPQTRAGVLIEGGWFPTPVTATRVRLQPVKYFTRDSTPGFWNGEAEIEHFVPEIRLETMARAGAIWREGGDSAAVDWTGATSVGVRLPRAVTFRVRGNRAAYLATPASLVASIMTDAVSTELQWSRRGWLGEAAFGRQYFPDDNAIRSAYAWILAPVLFRSSVELQAGYAFAADDSDETRFGPLSQPSVSPRPGRPQRTAEEGAYVPYYTPAHVVKHSMIGALVGNPRSRAIVRVDWSYALRATEDAPFLVGSDVAFDEAEFSAWDVGSSIELNRDGKTGLRFGAQIGRGAFYRWASVDVTILYRFLPNGPALAKPQ